MSGLPFALKTKLTLPSKKGASIFFNLFATAFRYTGIRNVHHRVPPYRDSRRDVTFLLVARERLV